MPLTLNLGDINSFRVINIPNPRAPSPPQKLLEKSTSRLLLNENTLIESIINYKPEDILEKKGSTPFLHSFVIGYPNLNTEIQNILQDPTNHNVSNTSAEFSCTYNGLRFSFTVTAPDTATTMQPSVSTVINSYNSVLAGSIAATQGGAGAAALNAGGGAVLRVRGDNRSFSLTGITGETGSIIIPVTSVNITVNLFGNTISFDLLDPSSLNVVPSLTLVDSLFSKLVDLTTGIQSADVYYKRLKVSSRSISPAVNNSYVVNGQTILSDASYNFNSSVFGTVTDKEANVAKVLGVSVEFAQTNLVSRRQVAYTCLATSREARSNATARELADFLKSQKIIPGDLTLSVTPVYKRDGAYLVPIAAAVEGLRDTAAKKRRFIKTVVQPI